MMWSSMFVKDTGTLHASVVIVNSIIPQAQEWFQGGKYIFIPCQTLKKSMEYLSLNNVKILNFPYDSPHLNPMEILWAIVKR